MKDKAEFDLNKHVKLASILAKISEMNVVEPPILKLAVTINESNEPLPIEPELEKQLSFIEKMPDKVAKKALQAILEQYQLPDLQKHFVKSKNTSVQHHISKEFIVKQLKKNMIGHETIIEKLAIVFSEWIANK